MSLSILVVTYNVGSHAIDQSFKEMAPQIDAPDVIAVCLQEAAGTMEDVHASEKGNYISRIKAGKRRFTLTNERHAHWISQCKNLSSVYGSYKHHTVALGGCMVVVLTKIHIQNIQKKTVNLGNIFVSNKGVAGIAFRAAGIDIAIAGAHLSSKGASKRKMQLINCLDNLSFGSIPFRKKHFCVFAGDLNFRILCDAHELINLGKIEELVKADTLNPLDFEMTEAQITFRPTYKLEREIEDEVSTEYFEKQSLIRNVGYCAKRIPSYTDRILYSNNNSGASVNCSLYTSVEYFRQSDHLPVLALFKVHSDGSLPILEQSNFFLLQAHGLKIVCFILILILLYLLN